MWYGVYMGKEDLEYELIYLTGFLRFLKEWPAPDGARLTAKDVQAALKIIGLNREDRLHIMTRLVPLTESGVAIPNGESQHSLRSRPSRSSS